MPTIQIKRAKEKAARELGFTLPELLRHFIASYLTDRPLPKNREWLSPEAENRLNKEVDDFYKHEYKDSKLYSSAQELKQVLETDE